jgi:hypothetical protein
MAPKTKFIIWGIQRTGTIFLTTALDSHPDILCIGEAFQDTEKPCNQDTSILRYVQYIKQSMSRRFLNHILRKQTVNKYLDYLYSLQNPRAIGFKLMLNQFKQYPSVLDRLKQDKTKVVHIHRANILKTHISSLRAHKTGVFYSSTAPDPYKIHVPCENIIEMLISLETKNTLLKEIINKYQLEHMTVSYEKLTNNLTAEASKILCFLGVDNNIELKPQSYKITSDHLEGAVENYSEIVKSLSNTKYESLLQ